MKGAIVFIVVFVALLALTLANTTIPPGRQIYNLLNVPDTNYLVANVLPATPFAISLINGAIYGIIAWLIFTVLWSFKKDTKQNISQTVNVNMGDKKGT